MIDGIKSIDHRAATRTLYELDGTTPRGEQIAVEFTACINDGSKHSLPNLWHGMGYTAEVLPSYWAVDVYATDAAGCWGCYNPTVKRLPNEPGNVLNFAWVLPATDENREKLLSEIIRRANA